MQKITLAGGFLFGTKICYNRDMFIENTKGWLVKVFEYGMYGFFALFPFFIFKYFLYQGSSSRFILLAVVSGILAICLGGYLLFNKQDKVSFFKSPILIVLGLYLAYLFISAIAGVDFAASFWSRAERTSGLFYLTHFIPFFLVLIHVFSKQDSRDRLIKVILVSSGIYSTCSFLGRQGLGILFRNNPYDGFMFGNSSFAAMYLLGAFMLSIYFVARKQSIKWFEYLIPFIFVANPFFINFKMFSRGISGPGDILGIAKASSIALVVSLGMLAVIFCISKIRQEKIRIKVAIGVAVLAFVSLLAMMVSLLNPEGVVRKAYEQQTTLARSLVWEISKEAASQKPVTGWGTDNFPVAFQNNFDNRLLEAEYGNEPWFDRAHNIVLDQAVDTGYVGIVLYFAIYLTLFSCLLFVILKAKDRQDVILGAVLITYFFVHILELQTAFDTTISYIMLAVMATLAIVVFDKVAQERGFKMRWNMPQSMHYGVGVVLVGYFGWALVVGTIPFWNVQRINGEIRTVGKVEKRLPLYPKLFETKVDLQGVLWRTVTDYQQGISQNPSVLENPEKAKALLAELDIFTKEYEKYVDKYPENFRAHLSLADVYIFHMLFGVNRLDEADVVLDRAIILAPEYPQALWMKAVTSLYRRKFDVARKYAEQAKKVNEKAEGTKEIDSYITDSIKTFPEIDLYFFKQI